MVGGANEGRQGARPGGIFEDRSGLMPRDLPLGNGRLLVAFDSRWRVKELFFPHVGMETHLLGRPCRVGVRDAAGSRTSWIGDDDWQLGLRYGDDAPGGGVTAP